MGKLLRLLFLYLLSVNLNQPWFNYNLFLKTGSYIFRTNRNQCKVK